MPPDISISEDEDSQSVSNNNDSISQIKVHNGGGRVCHFVTNLFNGIRIEPVFFLFAMGDSILGMIVQTYYIDRVCRITQGYETSICSNLTEYPDIEKELEKHVSELSMYQTLIESGFPLVLALFLGPLTDRFGYKPLMIYSISGYMLYVISMMSTCFMPMLPPQYLLISSIPLGLAGGVVTLMISSYGYMATQTNDTNRSYRLSALSGVWDIGTVIGYICGSTIFMRGSFLPTFSYTLTFYTLAFLYTLTFVRERKTEESELVGSSHLSSSLVIMDACSLEPVKELFHTACKARPGHRRKAIFVIVVATCFTYLAYASKYSQYLFTRNKFGWDTEKFSEFSAINTFLSGIGSTILTVFVMKLLKIKDVTVLLINTISNACAYSIYATAQHELQMFLGSGLQMFGTIQNAVFKSMLSKCVAKEEYGKLLSFVICAELSMPFISGPLYNLVFVQTMVILPGGIFFMAAGFTLVVLVLVGVLHILTRNIVEYSLVVNED